jgi:hypothetical protein
MGVLFDYFSAPSDEVAATAISRAGGPSESSEDTPRLPPFDTLQSTGIEPAVMLGKLEALLTGRDYKEIFDGPRAHKALAIEDDGEKVVETLTDELQAALAGADNERLAAVVVPWSEIDELKGAAPEGLACWLGEFAELARRARNRGERLYCWVCV